MGAGMDGGQECQYSTSNPSSVTMATSRHSKKWSIDFEWLKWKQFFDWPFISILTGCLGGHSRKLQGKWPVAAVISSSARHTTPEPTSPHTARHLPEVTNPHRPCYLGLPQDGHQLQTHWVGQSWDKPLCKNKNRNCLS